MIIETEIKNFLHYFCLSRTQAYAYVGTRKKEKKRARERMQREKIL
jgi:hypothetical protein